MKSGKIGIFVLLVVCISLIVSCKKDNTYEELRKQELETLAEYVETNNITVEPTSSGLYFIEVEQGEGDSIYIGDQVQVWYETYLIDSTLIDESGTYNPYEFTVGSSNTIQGLNEAVTYMQKGGKANLIIPSELAYGQNGAYNVSGFSTLLFSVEIYKVIKPGD